MLPNTSSFYMKKELWFHKFLGLNIHACRQIYRNWSMWGQSLIQFLQRQIYKTYCYYYYLVQISSSLGIKSSEFKLFSPLGWSASGFSAIRTIFCCLQKGLHARGVLKTGFALLAHFQILWFFLVTWIFQEYLKAENIYFNLKEQYRN